MKFGKTIAVLGCGLNRMYPKENEWLFHKILANGGCIISEYKQDVEPDMRYFPKRNRIISGISDGVLIVEAAHRSGSTITAKYAKEQEKKVYVIPSNIDSSNGIGSNNLIVQGANFVIAPEQIKKDLFKIKTSKQKISSKKGSEKLTGNKTSKLEIPKQYIEIYNVLENGPMHINEIAKRKGKSVQELSGILTLMEIEGFIIRLAQNQYKRKE